MQREKSIKKNAVFNVFKQCFSVLFPLATYPYISRILGAVNLGRYNFADSVVQYFLILAGLGISTYGIRESSIIKNDKESLYKLVTQLFTISFVSTLLSLLLLFLTVVFIDKIQADSSLIMILSLNIVFFFLGRDWINTLFEDFAYISIRYIIFHIISLILIFVFVRNQKDIYKYAIITVITTSGSYIANISHTNKMVRYGLTTDLNLRMHLKPILLLFCSIVAINIYIHSDVTILGFLRSSEEVGYYTVASKIYITVKGVFNAVIAVTIPRLSNYLGNGMKTEFVYILSKLRNVLYTLIIPSIVGLLMLSKDIIIIVGGDEYIKGTTSLRILCIALFFAVFGCFYTQGILVPNKCEKTFTIATIISALINIILNLLLIPIYGINGAALTTLIAEVIILIIAKYRTNNMGLMFESVDPKWIFSGCFTIAGICIAVGFFNFNVFVKVLLSIILSCISYTSILFSGRNELIGEILHNIFRNKEYDQ